MGYTTHGSGTKHPEKKKKQVGLWWIKLVHFRIQRLAKLLASCKISAHPWCTPAIPMS